MIDKTKLCRYGVITVKTTIISIGNSRGVRIPKPLLEESGLGKNVELKVAKGEIKIVPSLPELKTPHLNEEYLLSLSSLKDWDTPEEDAAWAHLQ